MTLMQKSKSEPNCQTTLSFGYPKRKSTGNIRHSMSLTSASPTITHSNKVRKIKKKKKKKVPPPPCSPFFRTC